MPETIAAKLVRRFRRNPEPDEVAVVLASEPGMVVGVPVAKTNVRSPRDLQHARLGSKHELKLLDNRDRIAAYAEYCRLDANIPEAGAALDIIASSAIGGEPGNQILGFDLEYAAEFPDADREFIGRLVDRLDLKELAKPIVRARTKFGDVFFHVIVDNLRQILQLHQKTIVRMCQTGRLKAFKMGNTRAGWRISEEDLNQYITEHLKQNA